MGKKGRTSVQKREREQKKRDRQLRKAAKAAKKQDSWPPPEPSDAQQERTPDDHRNGPGA